jgi:hypothetical protein
MPKLVGERRADVVDRIIEVLNRDFADAGSYRKNRATADEILTLIEGELSAPRDDPEERAAP